MSFFGQSLRTRIFFSMLFLILGASVIMGLVTISQFKNEAQHYHDERLDSKQRSINEHLAFVLRTTTYPVDTDKLHLIFKERIFEIKSIHKQNIYIYDLEGEPLISTNVSLLATEDAKVNPIEQDILYELKNSSDQHYIYKSKEQNQRFRSFYYYLSDDRSKPLGIVRLPYIEDDSVLKKDINAYMTKMGITYIFLLLLSILISYVLSRYITKSIKEVSDKIQQTRLDKINEKLEAAHLGKEISVLVDAYNDMIEELEYSAAQLAFAERETAWREMAKQVAHEVKNPLTPMRLSVQRFSMKFDPDKENIQEEVQEFSRGLIQQIDTITSVANAFSTYASMPEPSSEELDVIDAIKLALDVFDKSYIEFESTDDSLIAEVDKTHITRVITNLVKNSIQAIENNQIKDPKIKISLLKYDDFYCFLVADNGGGISEENQSLIFEPKFTTKSSGMGLGLGIVKTIIDSYSGEISLKNNEMKGATFELKFPLRK